MAYSVKSVQLSRLAIGTCVTLTTPKGSLTLTVTRGAIPMAENRIRGIAFTTEAPGVSHLAHPLNTVVPDEIEKDGWFRLGMFIGAKLDQYRINTDLGHVMVTEITIY